MRRMKKGSETRNLKAIRDHRRQWRQCLYVYPVISRRSKGLSIGVNLNLDKQCNFSCIYCQINRTVCRETHEVHIEFLHDELHMALEEATTGKLWAEPRFAATPKHLRRINDIAFSGDGEPTCLANFDKAVATAAKAKQECNADAAKLIVITNASQLQSPQFQRALPILDANNGEIWVKLDAGTEEVFQRINRPAEGITLRQILDNIIAVARDRDVVIQTLLFKTGGKVPPTGEIAAYCDRLAEIRGAGGKIKLIQLHTIARSPAEPDVAALTDAELDEIAERITLAVRPVRTEAYYGTDVQPQ